MPWPQKHNYERAVARICRENIKNQYGEHSKEVGYLVSNDFKALIISEN